MAEDLFPTHPTLSPPRTDEERLSWLRLIRSRRVGVTTFFRLMQDYGSAAEALKVLPEIARGAGVTSYSACPEGVARAEMAAAARCGARMLCYGAPGYPSDLMNTPDSPPVLWVRGDLALLSRPMIAMVGARNASSLGTRMARTLAGDLAEAGYTVVSGFARGIDTAAHQAAMARGTAAVFAGGIDVIYPAENAELAQKLFTTGLALSEQPLGTRPLARHFPMRNRIISGLALGVVVVEAALKSGSLITARNALDQGREVLAVPGHPIDARASGCNALIRDGATLVRSASDITEALAHTVAMPAAPVPPTPVSRAHPPRRPLGETATLHREILSRLSPNPIAEDQLIRDLDLPARAVNPELTSLELEGRIERRAGGLLALIR